MPEPEILGKVRQEIDYNLKEFNSIISNKTFKKHYPNGLWQEDKLKTVPKGYDKENPAIETLKNKHFIATSVCDEKLILSDGFLKHSTEAFKALYPLISFLNRVME